MKRIPKQKRSLLKYEGLLRAALLEFSENGYTQTTSKSIATRAGVATGSFYQYFDDKDDILYKLVGDRFENLKTRYFDLSDNMSGLAHNSERLRASIIGTLELMMDFHSELSGFHALIHHRRFIDSRLDDIIKTYDAAFDARVVEIVQPFKPRTMATSAFVVKAMAEGIVHSYIFDEPKDVNRTDAIEQGAQAIIHYLAAKE